MSLQEREDYLAGVRRRPGVVVTGQRALILEVLWDEGGVVRSEEGSATAVLQQLLEDRGHELTAKSLGNQLKDMEQRGLLVRDVRSKRTHAIGLPDERPAPSVSAMPDASVLARALLEEVGRVLASAGQGGAEARLAEAIEYGEGLEEDLAAVRAELEVCQGRLERAERLLQAVVRTGERPVSQRSFRAIESFVRGMG